MTSPLWWHVARPGFFIPAFFLSMAGLHAQDICYPAGITALGGSYVSIQDGQCITLNQAGMAWAPERSFSLHHSRPMLAGDLGISSIGIALPAGRSAAGMWLATSGLTGLRKSSLWISGGLKIGESLTAGAGIQLWTSSIAESFIYHPGIGCALGIQVRMDPALLLGCHVRNPFAGMWEKTPGPHTPMVLAVGGSYSIFGRAAFHAELQVQAGNGIRICQGVELTGPGMGGIMIGLHNKPFALSGGFCCRLKLWHICLAWELLFDSGQTPSISVSHAW